MIRRITLRNIKCFKHVSLPLSQLTLLTGINAAGKSTVLQSLTLLHQTATDNEASKSLLLNGSVISLGNAGDISDKLSGKKQLSIGIQGDDFECNWEMNYQERSSLSIPITCFSWQSSDNVGKKRINEKTKINHLIPTSLHSYPWAKQVEKWFLELTYLSAERWGPREIYPVTIVDSFINVGPHGENTPWVLRNFAEQIPQKKLLIDGLSKRLDRQVEAWMNLFFPGTNIQVTPIENTNLVTLGLRTNIATSFHRPQNVGYGLTHVLPILTAGLHANEGQIIMIENPEAHLHPSGQAMMGRFLANCAASGIQMIIETHSDHILNGIRIAVKEKLLGSDQVGIHFFMQPNQQEEYDEVNIVSPVIDSMGNLDYWPEGFFDQFDKDNFALINWG